jgi:hypothetical protein
MAALVCHVFQKRTQCKHITRICVISDRHVIAVVAVCSSKNVSWGIRTWKNSALSNSSFISYRIEHRTVRQLCRPFVANRSLAVSRFHFPNNWNIFEIVYSVWTSTAFRPNGWGLIFDGGNFFFQIFHRTVILERITSTSFFYFLFVPGKWA